MVDGLALLTWIIIMRMDTGETCEVEDIQLHISLNLRTTLSKCMRNPAMCKAAGRRISGSRSSTFSTFIHSS